MAEKRSWLDGPQVPGEFDGPDHESDYPGQKLGLTPKGPGSQATLMRRVGGVLIDWIISLIIAGAFFPLFGPNAEQMKQFNDTSTPIVFLIIGTISVWLFARTPGQWIVRMGVARVDDPSQRVGFLRAFFRSLLTLLLLPPIIVDSDMRGMHDRATGTAVIVSG